MSRAERLLDLLQVLRRHRRPVSGQALADELGISLRTLYRDIVVLQGQGAEIRGEAGIGYVLKPGFMLPPLMFSEEEIEALVLGSRWIARNTDARLGKAAHDAIARIAAVLPKDLRDGLEASTLLIGPHTPVGDDDTDVAAIREAIRRERKLTLAYRDKAGKATTRTIWPFAMGFFDRVRVIVAWCEMRKGFRHFRTDRMGAVKVESQRYPRRRQVLLKEWRDIEGIGPQ